MSEQNQKSLAQIGFEAFAETNKISLGWQELSEMDRDEYELIANAIEKEVLRRHGLIAPDLSPVEKKFQWNEVIKWIHGLPAQSMLPGERAYNIFIRALSPGYPDNKYSPLSSQWKNVREAFAAVERELTKRDEDTGTH